MKHVIEDLGGPAAVARICKVRPPSVIEWRRRGIPAERCPDLERASEGRHPCEQLRADVVWHRVPDAEWPWHPAGRPLIDVTRQAPATQPQAAAWHRRRSMQEPSAIALPINTAAGIPMLALHGRGAGPYGLADGQVPPPLRCSKAPLFLSDEVLEVAIECAQQRLSLASVLHELLAPGITAKAQRLEQWLSRPLPSPADTPVSAGSSLGGTTAS